MDKKQVERYYQLIEYANRNNKKILLEEFIKGSEMDSYARRFYQNESMFDDVNSLVEGVDSSIVVDLINNDEFVVNDVAEFKKSLHSSSRGEFLSDYSDEDYSKMKTYQVKGYNAGFAIKSDGDIVSVHNNTGIPGLGKPLLRKAVEYGGTKLDHFDGYLTGLYDSLGFKVVSTDEWNDDYAPSGWKYEPVDVFNSNRSVYASQLAKYKDNVEAMPDSLKAVVKRYKEGKPDIIYRTIN